jgi:hypothetical protein
VGAQWGLGFHRHQVAELGPATELVILWPATTYRFYIYIYIERVFFEPIKKEVGQAETLATWYNI